MQNLYEFILHTFLIRIVKPSTSKTVSKMFDHYLKVADLNTGFRYPNVFVLLILVVISFKSLVICDDSLNSLKEYP